MSLLEQRRDTLSFAKHGLIIFFLFCFSVSCRSAKHSDIDSDTESEQDSASDLDSETLDSETEPPVADTEDTGNSTDSDTHSSRDTESDLLDSDTDSGNDGSESD